MKNTEVRYSELRPAEFRTRVAERPLAYLPLGTLEWHGEHLPLGADSIQSEGLMIECARRLGGIVMPPIHLGPDRAKPVDNGNVLIGMDYEDVTVPHRPLEGSAYWVSKGFFNSLIDAILLQVKRAGFTAVFADGHGPSRLSWVEEIPERETRFDLKLFGVTSDIFPRWQIQMDHAAQNETSITMHLRPELVDLSQLSESRSDWPQGVAGDDPRDATAEFGATCIDTAVEIIGEKLAAAGLLE